jgi:L-alanine-DL-glutamate epimerase-like enolase superfamily enzyme
VAPAEKVTQIMIRESVVPIERADVSVYRIPTEKQPESDGTLIWDHTTVVVVQVVAGGLGSLGYTYANAAAGLVVRETLAPVLVGLDALAIPGCWQRMVGAVRNLGNRGIAAMAVSAVDAALWDLKARLLGLPLVRLLGAVRESVPVYGSGGFTSYTLAELRAQLGGWSDEGMRMVKMKSGRDPGADLARVAAAREAIAPAVELFVDANGAYRRKQALAFAESFAGLGVRWFEEPVSADDLDGLRLLRDRAPRGMEIAAGEYGYDLGYFRRMLAAGAVDVLQADATRCDGITGFIAAAALCRAHHVPLSAHCAPSLHAHLGCALPEVRHLEYFFDHARVEAMLFEGAAQAKEGSLRPDLERPGMGLELKKRDAERWRT